MPPIVDPVTSPTLLRRLQSPTDDPDGWPRFVREYEPLVLGWLRAKGLQDADARDLSQDVLLRFSRIAARFSHDPSRRFRGFLRTLTHAAWCDWSERRRRWPHGSGDSSFGRLADACAADDETGMSIAIQEDAELLRRAFEEVRRRVEARTWEAFRLLALEGLSGDEAADRLGMRRGSAHAARCKVQRLVREAIARLEVAAPGA